MHKEEHEKVNFRNTINRSKLRTTVFSGIHRVLFMHANLSKFIVRSCTKAIKQKIMSKGIAIPTLINLSFI